MNKVKKTYKQKIEKWNRILKFAANTDTEIIIYKKDGNHDRGSVTEYNVEKLSFGFESILDDTITDQCISELADIKFSHLNYS